MPSSEQLLILAAAALQFILAPKPATAFFLEPQERALLADRQDTLDSVANAQHGRQGKWWASIVGEPLPSLQACDAVQPHSRCASAMT